MKGTVKELIPKMLNLDESKEYIVTEYKKKRSLNANNYYWQLLTKIADILRISKETLHMKFLKEYGQITSICVPANYELKGFIKYYEHDGTFWKNNTKYYVYNIFKPSSEMNTKEMSILIDGVVQEAKSLGIETMTPEEIDHIKSLWGKE